MNWFEKLGFGNAPIAVETPAPTVKVTPPAPVVPVGPLRNRFEPFKVKPVPLDADVTVLGREAKEVLGYTRLDSSIRLKNALAKLEIEPLDFQKVHDYMQKMASETGKVWESKEISKYLDRMPEFVIRKAIQIKQELPDAVIEVKFLPKEDPFLWVELDDRGYYIEVWEEPKFESKYL